jgi:hypothetical protein
MDKEKTSLQKAIEALESAGFHVDRAYEENYREAGSVGEYHAAHEHTGAICLRIAPAVPATGGVSPLR